MIKKLLMNGLGFVSLGLGIVGLFVPVLPTTPLVLLASFCFASNPKMLKLITNSPIIGSYINNYHNKTGISRRLKIGTIIFVTASMMFSFYVAPFVWLKIVIAAVYITITIHVLLLKTKAK